MLGYKCQKKKKRSRTFNYVYIAYVKSVEEEGKNGKKGTDLSYYFNLK